MGNLVDMDVIWAVEMEFLPLCRNGLDCPEADLHTEKCGRK